MGLSRTISVTDGDFRRKSQNFPTPCILRPHWRVPLRIGYRRSGSKKLELWGYRAEKKVWQYLQPSGYNTPTWRTDIRTDTGWQQWPRLHIVLRGKNYAKTKIDRAWFTRLLWHLARKRSRVGEWAGFNVPTYWLTVVKLFTHVPVARQCNLEVARLTAWQQNGPESNVHTLNCESEMLTIIYLANLTKFHLQLYQMMIHPISHTGNLGKCQSNFGSLLYEWFTIWVV